MALDSHVEQVIPPCTEFCPTEKTALDEEVRESLRIASPPPPGGHPAWRIGVRTTWPATGHFLLSHLLPLFS